VTDAHQSAFSGDFGAAAGRGARDSRRCFELLLEGADDGAGRLGGLVVPGLWRRLGTVFVRSWATLVF
jgi:hypothetical protein